jgi:hypothetical protein
LGLNASIHHPKDAIKKLEKLEKETGMPELDAAYEDIYQMNTAEDSESRKITMRAYRWILAAQRQLLISELTEAVSYDEEGVSDSALTPELLLKLCSNFVFADSSHVIQFSHLSAREFLEKRRSNSALDYSVVQNHNQAAISCLSFLTGTNLYNITSFTKGTRFPGYAVIFWMVHVQLSQGLREGPQLKSLFEDMVSNVSDHRNSAFVGWADALSRANHDLSHEYDASGHNSRLLATEANPPTPLFLACAWGFHDIFDIPSCVFDLKQLNVERKTALYIACKYGSHEVARILLERGADVDAITGTHGSALQAAASGGHERIVELLLERGASLNLRDEWNTSALGAAA